MLHHRKKSGNTSMTDVRKSVTATDSSAKHRRPAMTRRHTPASAQLLGRRHRDRERDCWQDGWDDERESFPQFCMTCEKQFVPHDEKFLYCSDTCRRIDQSSTSATGHQAASLSSRFGTYTGGELGFAAAGNPEPRDIIPRATPSRPTSIHLSNSPPGSPGTKAHHSSAISALRSLNIGPSSPPSPTGSNGSSIWPFGRSVATSPGTSYTRPSAPYLSSTLDGGHYYGGGGYTHTYEDRPLPSRHPGAYSRPKSIELVTPVVGR
ncbi:life-span regulatory factor domain-containing protein [Hirsutella rhossiliensis]|uniref:Life-span regulatory factor domain-containing protein n=1 Tax=Hirsutella rhossiliensis TaxID=111463 RepID=A0A9P8SI94_9HYPO|nr:life-span regulatory factor domain-containing protein [Hirsutella rhossiliensis]KAH0962959.1 life-span regulatory factor domain-containing protein [Hirsutella rhossiliensis]